MGKKKKGKNRGRLPASYMLAGDWEERVAAHNVTSGRARETHLLQKGREGPWNGLRCKWSTIIGGERILPAVHFRKEAGLNLGNERAQ